MSAIWALMPVVGLGWTPATRTLDDRPSIEDGRLGEGGDPGEICSSPKVAKRDLLAATTTCEAPEVAIGDVCG
jgi:hypothetical protein